MVNADKHFELPKLCVTPKQKQTVNTDNAALQLSELSERNENGQETNSE